MKKINVAFICAVVSVVAPSTFAQNISIPAPIIYPELVVAGTPQPNAPVDGEMVFNNLNSASNLSVWNITCDYTASSPKAVWLGLSLQSLGDTIGTYTFKLNGKIYSSHFVRGILGTVAGHGSITWTNVVPAVSESPLTLLIHNYDQDGVTMNCQASWVKSYS